MIIKVKILSLAIAVALLLCSLCGCGEKSETSSNNSQSNDSSEIVVSSNTDNVLDDNSKVSDTNSNGTENTSSTVSTDNGLRGTTVIFATWEDMRGSADAKTITNFTKKTGIKVSIKKINMNDYITKVSAQIAAGSAPDVIIDNQMFPRTVPLLQPLSSGDVNVGDSIFDQAIVKLGTVKGKNYLVGRKGDVRFYILAYNKAVFRENGI